MNCKFICALICVLLTGMSQTSWAQTPDSKLPLAILPFVASKGAVINNEGNLNSVQEAIAKEFTTKSRFLVLDRSKFEDVVKALKIESSEQFLNSELLERGKAIGARYLVAGVLNELKVVKGERNVPVNPLKPFGEKTRMVYYQSSLRLSFAVIDVQTQQLIYNEPLHVASRDYLDGSEVTSITKVIEEMQSEVKGKIRSLFPVSMKIVHIDKLDKKGLPEIVLVNGGGSMFSEAEGRNVRLGVYLTEMIGDLKREKQVGELKVMKVEGDIIKCEVRDGEKEIQDNMSASDKTMFVKVLNK